MKICYLANAASIHTKRWAQHFHGLGHEVTVISFDPGEIEGPRVIVLPSRASDRRLNILLNIVGIHRLVQQNRPDILHAHYVTSYGFAGAFAGKHPYIVTAWGTDVLIEPEKSWIYRRIVKFALHKADLITSMAPHMTDHLIGRLHVPADKMITLPFGVDTNTFNPTQRTRPHGNDDFIVVSTRRPDYGMDVDTFVRAIPAVLDKFNNSRFIITGEGPLRQEIQKLVLDLGVTEYVEFLGEIPHSDMPALLGTADVFVSTSPSDGNNISLNEATACGAFPVATNIPANQYWIESGKNGLLYSCRDVNQLARGIIKTLEQPEWRNAVMEENWEIARTRASWAQSMERITEQYHRLLKKPH